MIVLTERVLEFAKKTADGIRVIRESNNRDLPTKARDNLLKVRILLKSSLKQIDEIFEVEEL